MDNFKIFLNDLTADDTFVNDILQQYFNVAD